MAEATTIQPSFVKPKQGEADIKPRLEEVKIEKPGLEEKKDEVVISSEKVKLKKEKGNLHRLWGILKGFVKEGISTVGFFANFIFSPIKSTKEFCSGISGLCKLITNPTLLKEAISSGWEAYKNADAEEKGEILGRLLFNFTPAASLLNVRLISKVNRLTTGLSAIAKETKHLRALYKERGLADVFKNANYIAKRANVEKDFMRALKLEGIPKELMPTLQVGELPKGAGAAFMPEIYTVRVNSLVFEKGSSKYIGKAIRHEVKHVGQALSLAKSGLPIPKKSIQLFIQDLFKDRFTLEANRRIYAVKQSLEKKLGITIQHNGMLAYHLEKVYPNGIPLIPDALVEAVRSNPKFKIATKINPEDIGQAFIEADRYAKKYTKAKTLQELKRTIERTVERKGDLLTKVEKLMKKADRTTKRLEKRTSRSKMRDLRNFEISVRRLSRMIVPVVPTVKKAIKSWAQRVLTRRKQYLNTPLEKEAFAVQREYVGLAPRLHTPSIHNIPRLSRENADEKPKTSTGKELNSAA